MSRRGWALFVALGVIWGIPYLLIKVAVEDLSPAMLVLARTGLASLLIVPSRRPVISSGCCCPGGVRSSSIPPSRSAYRGSCSVTQSSDCRAR